MKEPRHPTLREDMATRDIIPFIGVYDVFSASIAGKYFDALFISGFSFAASHYGLPDIGFIAWTDIVDFVRRVRTVLPRHHILVDIDDGYCDVEVACHVVSLLEAAGASGVILEDQKRPRRCGHFNGKQLMEVGEYLEKLERVLATRHEMVVVARTDAVAEQDRAERVRAFAKTGADAILIDGMEDLMLITKLGKELGRPMMFNKIAGGKSPNFSLSQLREAGVSLVNYSTPCLFAAQESLEIAMQSLCANDGMLPIDDEQRVGVTECTSLLKENLVRRDEKE